MFNLYSWDSKDPNHSFTDSLLKSLDSLMATSPSKKFGNVLKILSIQPFDLEYLHQSLLIGLQRS